MKIEIVDSIRQPEYTGDDRCEPCTVLNLVIAVALGSLIARKSKLAGAIAVVVSVGLIYLRGYLIPGTPTLTKRYLPPTVLRWFGKETDPDVATGFSGIDTTASSPNGESETPTLTGESPPGVSSTGTDSPAAAAPTNEGQPAPTEDLETFFMEHDILEPCADTDDLCLTDSFESAWFDEIELLTDEDVDAGDISDAIGIDGDHHELEVVSQDDAYLLQTDSRRVGQWPSRPALIADVAASRVLRSWVADWHEYDPEEKGHLLNSLRMFLETCPTTDGDIRMDEEVVESCCSTHSVIAVTCEETGERLFEHQVDTADV